MKKKKRGGGGDVIFEVNLIEEIILICQLKQYKLEMSNWDKLARSIAPPLLWTVTYYFTHKPQKWYNKKCRE